MARTEDALDLLLGDADEPLVRQARDVTHFLRLLSDDARGVRAHAVGVDVERARDELERHLARRVEGALADLLRLHLEHALEAESFAWFGEPRQSAQAAWRTLLEAQGELAWLAGVPEPGEDALAVAQRLLASLEQLHGGEERLWRLRLARVQGGAEAAEPLYQSALSDALRPVELERAARTRVSELLAGTVECLLDRGRVREARNLLALHLAWVGGDARLRQLLCWTKLCLGDFAGAKGALVGQRAWSGRLPAGLVELRERRAEWLPCLVGRATRKAAEVAARLCGPVRQDRSAIGAVSVVAFALEQRAITRPWHVDLAPALRERLAGWIAEREGAHAVPGEPEHRVLLENRPIVWHPDAAQTVHSTLGRASTLTCALVPLRDGDGEPRGWIQLEFEHFLAPTTARLTQLAEHWRTEFAARRASAIECSSAVVARGASSVSEVAALGLHGVQDTQGVLERPGLATVFDELFAALNMKATQRRWEGFVLDPGSDVPSRVASGGEGAGLDEHGPGRGRALLRALAAGGHVLFEDADVGLARHAAAQAGLVLVLRLEGRPFAALAIESGRRRDFRAADLERCAGLLEPWAVELRLAQFRAWHRTSFGFDVWFDGRRGDFRGFARSLVVAARARAPVVLSGPAGAGKTILARWLHFESARSNGPWRVIGAHVRWPLGGLEELLQECSGGTLVCDDLEGFAPERQEELLRWLERSSLDVAGNARVSSREPLDVRLVATSRSGLKRAADEGRLRHDLAQRLDRFQLWVPGLERRREDIVPLTLCFAARFAEEEGVRRPTFSEEAFAHLWRQRWEGNVRELESFLYKLVLFRPGSVIELADVAQVATSFGRELVRKLPSRHPARADLLGALRMTRMSNGRANKTRAALYLGWDPDTLVARMQDLGVNEDEAGLEGSWSPDALISPATDD